MNILKNLLIWVCWYYISTSSGLSKKPCSIDGRETGTDAAHHQTWVTYDEAVAAKEWHQFDGVGFVVPKGWFFLDIDHRTTDDPLVQEILNRFQTYAEKSVSGEGIHLYGRCDLARIPTYRDEKGNLKLSKEYYQKNPHNKMELYIGGLTNRFSVYTGNAINNEPIRDCTEAILMTLDKDMRRKLPPTDDVVERTTPCTGSHGDIVQALRNQKNGAKFSRLYDQGDIAGYPSHSEADVALCTIIAFRTGPDPDAINAIFCTSALYRDKWDREDYKKATITKAIANCNGTFYKSPASYIIDNCRNSRFLETQPKTESESCEKMQREEIEQADIRFQAEQVVEVIAPPDIEPTKRGLRKLKTAETLMQKDLPDPRVFVGVGDELPLLVEGTCILSAKPKLGKSWLVLGMCLAVARGEDFLGYKTRQCSVLYLDLETSEQLQKKRLEKALHGEPVPKNFYLETETDPIGKGFCEQIESYLAEDPDIGIVVVDVFQMIRSAAKTYKESEYEHAYRDFAPLNALTQKYHISIILVCHDRKAVDPDDPFANILGSTGLQGAATQMVVMCRRRMEDPIHISVKGKTIDGLPELDAVLEDGRWRVVDGATTADREKEQMNHEYRTSEIRRAVTELVKRDFCWKGRCSDLISAAVQCGVAVTDTPKMVGKFLHLHQGRLLAEDNIKLTIIANGTGSKIYRVEKFTVDTVDGISDLLDEGFEKVSNSAESQIPFT